MWGGRAGTWVEGEGGEGRLDGWGGLGVGEGTREAGKGEGGVSWAGWGGRRGRVVGEVFCVHGLEAGEVLEYRRKRLGGGLERMWGRGVRAGGDVVEAKGIRLRKGDIAWGGSGRLGGLSRRVWVIG